MASSETGNPGSLGEAVESAGYDVETRLVMVRQKLEPDPSQPEHFLTIRGTMTA